MYLNRGGQNLEPKRKKKRRIKKRAIFILALILIVIICVVIQVYFTPDWYDGNTKEVTTSENGVHTQERTAFNEDELTQNISITN